MASTDTLASLQAVPRRYFDAWNGRDVHAIDAVLADDLEWTDPSLPAPITDLAGAHAFMTASWQGFPDLRFELLGAPLVDADGGRVGTTLAAQLGLVGQPA